jgi:hypothetical protein
MLLSEKQRLERNLARDLLLLRQKELAHLTNCCCTLAVPSALFVGFAYIGMSQVEFPERTPWWLVALCFETSMLCMAFNMAATIRASFVGLMGPALALRGKPGAMHRAVETMGPCFVGSWVYFLLGMVFVFLSTIVNVFIQARYTYNGALASAVVAIGGVLIFRDIRHLHATFDLPREDVVGAGFSRKELSAIVRRYASRAERVPTPSASPPSAPSGPAPGAAAARSVEASGAGAFDSLAALPRRARPRHIKSTLFFRATHDPRATAGPTGGRAGQL